MKKYKKGVMIKTRGSSRREVLVLLLLLET
jgi:hypothetical protein